MDSDRPTLRPRPHKLEVIIEKVKNLAHALAVIVGAASAFGGTMWLFYEKLATDAELASYIEAHNKAPEAHMLRDKLSMLEAKQAKLQEDVDIGHAADVALGSKLVSLIAADREPSNSLRAAAATFYREEYARLIRRGTPVEDAILEALRTPWHERRR